MISDLKIPEKYQPYLRIGTCSWKYDSWRGLVYDRDKYYAADEYLADYARYFKAPRITPNRGIPFMPMFRRANAR